jgi:hydroxypyruvate isomerase
MRSNLGVHGGVQIADHPGRHESGTGTLDLDRYLRRIRDGDYTGYVALGYIPTGATLDSLGWLPRERRSLSFT